MTPRPRLRYDGGVTAWDFPFVIVAAVAVALAVSWALIRVAAQKRPPAYECLVCGRKHDGVLGREWRYCPYCGAPRGAKSTAALLRREPPA